MAFFKKFVLKIKRVYFPKSKEIGMGLGFFRPVHLSEDKKNFRPYYLIKRDGTRIERILLDFPTKEQREEVIYRHFLLILGIPINNQDECYSVLSRDAPWDFKVLSKDGEKFNIEITSIAESVWSFEKSKRQEVYMEEIAKPRVFLFRLKKFASWFGDKELEQYVINHQNKGFSGNDLVKNPLFGKKYPTIFLSDTKEESDNLSELIFEAIESKSTKKHSGKNKTVLIIDNRTVKFAIADFKKFLKIIRKKKTSFPFKDILFYTGYYSDDDGDRSEFSFAPIKLSDELSKKLSKNINTKRNFVGKDGVCYI